MPSFRRDRRPSFTSSEDESPPSSKRQRTTAQRAPSPCQQLLLEEIDLEIGLQDRLRATVESRITWALLLQEALEKDVNAPLSKISGFQDAALDALQAIEAPCEVLFTREVRPPEAPSHIPTATATPIPQTPPDPPQPTSIYSTRTRGLPRASRPPPRKLLYLRNVTKYPPEIAKLACPDCSRTDFSSLQGLLNHCRLSHKREFGSHDDCVQSSAVLIEGAESQAWVVANGTEVGGISLPGLRRLFEIAVGGGRDILPISMPTQVAKLEHLEEPLQHNGMDYFRPIEDAEQEIAPSIPAHLTRTLGHHMDSPALAPYLGRAPQKRCINAYIQDENLDILSLVETAHPKRSWRMPYTHRNKARASLDEVVDLPETSNEPQDKASSQIAYAEPPTSSAAGMHGLGSRFHILARVSVRDLSLWMPPSRRPNSRPDDTHRWRLALSSPSYSLSLNAFLRKLIVTCLSDDPPSTLLEPITVDKPPFVLTSTTDRPFLARLTLVWAGTECQNPPLDIEHWVELDPLHLSHPVAGDEQVFDVELDRNTELLPAHEDPCTTSWHSDTASYGHDGERQIETKDTDEKNDEPDYVVKLKMLLPQVPRTMKDVKGRLSGRLAYTLVSTPAQYRNLAYGRRKAIEWARARVLRDAYNALEDGQASVPLTVGDIFCWLSDEGPFPRQVNTKFATNAKSAATSRRKSALKTDPQESEIFCRVCGLHFQLHPSASSINPPSLSSGPTRDDIKLEPTLDVIPIKPATPLACTTFASCGGEHRRMNLPLMDVRPLLAFPTLSHQNTPPFHTSSTFLVPGSDGRSAFYSTISSHDVVALADPRLMGAIQALCSSWKLKCLADRSRISRVAPLTVDNSPADIEDELAPFALLSLLTTSFTKFLIRRGIDSYHRDEAGLRALGRQRTRKNTPVKRLLTPSHIHRGLLHNASQSAEDAAFLLALAPLGISLPNIPETAGDDGDATAAHS